MAHHYRAVARGNAVGGEFLAVYGDFNALAVRNFKDVVTREIGVHVVALRAAAVAKALSETRVAPDYVAFFACDGNGIFVFFKIFGIKVLDSFGSAAHCPFYVVAEAQREHEHYRK